MGRDQGAMCKATQTPSCLLLARQAGRPRTQNRAEGSELWKWLLRGAFLGETVVLGPGLPSLRDQTHEKWVPPHNDRQVPAPPHSPRW